MTQSCQCSERLPGGGPSGRTTAPRYPSHGRTSAPHPTRSSVTHPAAQVQLLKTSHLTNLGEDFGPEIPWENLANVETFRPRRKGQLNKAEKKEITLSSSIQVTGSLLERNGISPKILLFQPGL